MVTMLDYIQEEQETLSTIITKYRYQKNAKLTKAKHLLILATGSSYNACLAAKVFFEKVSGTTVTIEEPYHFQHYENYLKQWMVSLLCRRVEKVLLQLTHLEIFKRECVSRLC
jgi:glucoselysine-6-phosphate deglycase